MVADAGLIRAASEFTNSEWPLLPCPFCPNGQLVKSDIHIQKTMESASLGGHPDWEPCWISGYFYGTLQCARPGCREWVIVPGEMRYDMISNELDYHDGKSWDYWLRLRYTVPALPIVSPLPDGCPSVVKSRILEASRVLWADPSAAANRLRLAIEDLLTARKIKRFTIGRNGKRTTLTLHGRVDILRETNHEVGDTLEGPYLRYECEWGYAYNVQAGEDVRILDLAETPVPPGLVDHDFWLADNELVVLMHYDDAGQFLGGEALPETETPRYVAARDAAWAAATPFEPWWAARPQYHRSAGLVG